VRFSFGSFLGHFPWARLLFLGTGLGGGQKGCLQRAATAQTTDRKWTVHILAMISIGHTQVMNKQKKKKKKTAPRATAIIFVDNRAAPETLQFNKHNHEYAHWALETIRDLSLLGWEIITTWCSFHCNINGNEQADTLAKWGASSAVPCRFTLTTKTWLLAQAPVELLRQWKTELPLSRHSFKFPSHLHGVDHTDTRAIWRVFCNRSPSDPTPNIPADPYPYSTDLISPHHLLRDCPLLMPHWALLRKATTGDIQSLKFITAPENSNPLHRFLRATGLGHSTLIQFDGSHNTPDGTNTSDSDSPQPDFGTFEPYPIPRPTRQTGGRIEAIGFSFVLSERFLVSLFCVMYCDP